MYFALLSNIFPPHVRGGYELGCQSIARALVRLGHRVVVLTSTSIGQLNRTRRSEDLQICTLFEPVFEYEDLLNAKMVNSGYWHRRRDEAFGGIVVSNALSLARFLAESRPDVLWMFNPLGLGPVGIFEAALSYPLKCIIHLMENVDDTIDQYQHSIFLEGRYRRLKASMTAISCSRRILIRNERIGSYRSHRIIHNGINFDQIPCRCEPVRTSERTCRFVYFGQVSEIKGVLHMLRAAKLVDSRSFTIDIIGRCEPTFEARMRDEISELGLAEIVKFCGFVSREDLFPRLTEYDAAILLLSNSEPFAFAPVEAAAAGLPVILTSGGGNAECFPDNYPLLVHDRDDAAETASKLNWCILHMRTLRALGMRLREHLKGYCDLDSVVMPAYLRTIRACPINQRGFNVEDLVASYMTSKLYHQVGW